jgi:hypothetical protein
LPKEETKIETLADLYDDPVLFDAQLLNPHTKATHKCHKAVVASGSKYMIRMFEGIPEFKEKGGVDLLTPDLLLEPQPIMVPMPYKVS